MSVLHWIGAINLVVLHLGNAMMGGSIHSTPSARAGYARERGSTMGAGVCHMLDWIDPHDGDSPNGDHCTIAMRHDRERH
jgi:hypothetical protein